MVPTLERCVRAPARDGAFLAPDDCFDPEHFRIGFGVEAAGFARHLKLPPEGWVLARKGAARVSSPLSNSYILN